MEKATPVISIRNLSKSFEIGNQTIPVLKDINLEIGERDFVVIFGPSGCGKSTLLYTLLGLETPTSGIVEVLGENIYKSDEEDDRTEFRKKHIGMVYQQSNWINSLTVIENVALPLVLSGKSKTESLERALKMLTVAKMEEWANYKPAELSSGQQQKVAVARAIITDPEMIVADEPTGNLDFESGQYLIHLLGDLNHVGKTVVMVTHDLEYLKYAKTVVRMLDGKIVDVYDGRSEDIMSKAGVKCKKENNDKELKR
jgi:putative ABC transport system ATP-binding protein